MSDAAEKIRAIFDKIAVDALGKQLGRPEGTAHATVTATDDTIDVLIEFDPPSYLPMQPHEAPRIPDLCPDETWTDETLAIHDTEKAIDEAKWLAESDARPYRLDEPHNPETCRDPACDCMPF